MRDPGSKGGLLTSAAVATSEDPFTPRLQWRDRAGFGPASLFLRTVLRGGVHAGDAPKSSATGRADPSVGPKLASFRPNEWRPLAPVGEANGPGHLEATRFGTGAAAGGVGEVEGFDAPASLDGARPSRALRSG
jgi:hypothetical protein